MSAWRTGCGLACGALLASIAPPLRATELAESVRILPIVEQRLALFTSPWVTAGGLGGGFGLEALWARRFVIETQMDALWAMGNAGMFQLSVGVQRDGVYQPGLRLACSVLFGDRIEMLYDDGRRPAKPSWAVGPRILPVRFGTSQAFASALEAGLGSDFRGGLLIEVVLLKAGAHW